MEEEFKTEKKYSKLLDSNDPLGSFPSKFHVPHNLIYMNGNSLGLLPKAGEETLLRVLDEWKTAVIEGNFTYKINKILTYSLLCKGLNK